MTRTIPIVLILLLSPFAGCLTLEGGEGATFSWGIGGSTSAAIEVPDHEIDPHAEGLFSAFTSTYSDSLGCDPNPDWDFLMIYQINLLSHCRWPDNSESVQMVALHQTEQDFLDAHARAYIRFGRMLDNLSSVGASSHPLVNEMIGIMASRIVALVNELDVAMRHFQDYQNGVTYREPHGKDYALKAAYMNLLAHEYETEAGEVFARSVRETLEVCQPDLEGVRQELIAATERLESALDQVDPPEGMEEYTEETIAWIRDNILPIANRTIDHDVAPAIIARYATTVRYHDYLLAHEETVLPTRGEATHMMNEKLSRHDSPGLFSMFSILGQELLVGEDVFQWEEHPGAAYKVLSLVDMPWDWSPMQCDEQ